MIPTKIQKKIIYTFNRLRFLQDQDKQQDEDVETKSRVDAPSIKSRNNCWRSRFSLIIFMIAVGGYLLDSRPTYNLNGLIHTKGLVMLARGHIVLTRDDTGQSLVLTGEDGKGKGKGGKGGGGGQLVITGNSMGGGGEQNSNMVMQEASNRDGDVVINGNSMIVPGEDGHIVLADNRSRQGQSGGSPPPIPANLFAFWMPYLNSRMDYRMMPYLVNQFG